jgi:hypothetical protein
MRNIPICFAWNGSVFYSAIDHKPNRVAPTQLVRLQNWSPRSSRRLTQPGRKTTDSIASTCWKKRPRSCAA